MKTEVQTKTQVFTMKKCRILSCVCAFQTLLGSDILSLNPTWKPKIQSDDRRVGLTAGGGVPRYQPSVHPPPCNRQPQTAASQTPPHSPSTCQTHTKILPVREIL